MARTAISRGKRFAIFDRDRFTCAYCGRTPPGVVLHVDHIVPVVEGGSDDEDNLITACSDCNLGKGRRQLGSEPQINHAERLEVAKEKYEQLAAYYAYQERLNEERERLIDLVGNAYFAWKGPDLTFHYEQATGRRASVGRFLDRLPLEEVIDAARISGGAYMGGRASDQWRYFCGVCWRKIRGDS